MWYTDPTICDIAIWRFVRSRSDKLFSVRCYRPPYYRYITLLGPREVSMILRLFAGRSVKYHELSARMRESLDRLIKKKLVIVDDGYVVLTEGGKSVARVLQKHFDQKRRLGKRSKLS